ncbi:MAG: FAD-binding oxidoreductase, partial [Myxococcota bacterium]
MGSSAALTSQEPFARRILNARILERNDLNGSMAVFRVAPEGPLQFIPGQYVTFGVPTGPAGFREEAEVVLRPYSISSSVRDAMSPEFLIRRVEGGEGTERLWKLSKGDALWVSETA